MLAVVVLYFLRMIVLHILRERRFRRMPDVTEEIARANSRPVSALQTTRPYKEHRNARLSDQRRDPVRQPRSRS